VVTVKKIEMICSSSTRFDLTIDRKSVCVAWAIASLVFASAVTAHECHGRSLPLPHFNQAESRAIQIERCVRSADTRIGAVLEIGDVLDERIKCQVADHASRAGEVDAKHMRRV